MKKSHLALKSAAIFGASLCWLPAVSGQAVTYYADQNPNRPNGSGGQWGNDYDLIDSVVITTGYEDVQANSTNPPANAVTAPTLFIQVNVNPGTAATPTDITSNTMWWCDYDVAMETIPGAGQVTTPTTVVNPYGNAYGISTGENYYINGFNNKPSGDATSTSGDNELFNYANGAWSPVAGYSTSPYLATTTTITPTSITYGIPLADFGLSIGNTFTFDVYSSYGGYLPYDALDNASFAPPNYYPYTGGPSPEATAYDSATEPGSTLNSYTVATPTLTWNNSFAAAGYSDGMTWDTNDTNNYNWNNGIFADYYVDGSNVIFNDVNNSTSSGGTNPNAYNVTLNTTVFPGSVVVNNSLGNYTISGAGSIGGTASLTKEGAGTLTISTANTYSGGTTVTAGMLQIEPTGSAAAALPKGALTISGSGEVQIASNVTAGSALGASNINITSLSISGNGTLDITNNQIIIDYGSPATDPIASIESWIKSGYAGGSWTGTGITSSMAASNSGSYGIGYADSADSGNPADLASGTIEIMYTLLGDANLDGKVNGADFAIMAANFNQGGKSWDQGDFNYDGNVNGADFTLLAKNFNQSATQSAVAAADLAALDAFAAANGISLSNVPEPASAALAVMIGIGALSRRRRKI
jgi:autotransporter-associated beta strand protein